MRGNPRVLDYLQQAVKAELTAINQYVRHAEVLRNLGFVRLADKWKAEAAEEGGHRDRFLARLLFLEGDVDMQVNPIRMGDSLEAIFRADLAAEMEGRALYTQAAGAALEAGDVTTFTLFQSILADEEGHIDFLETQLRLLASVTPRQYGAQYLDEMESD